MCNYDVDGRGVCQRRYPKLRRCTPTLLRSDSQGVYSTRSNTTSLSQRIRAHTSRLGQVTGADRTVAFDRWGSKCYQLERALHPETWCGCTRLDACGLVHIPVNFFGSIRTPIATRMAGISQRLLFAVRCSPDVCKRSGTTSVLVNVIA